MDIKLTESDCSVLQVDFPDLECDLDAAVVCGDVEFACSYDAAKYELVFDNCFSNYLTDKYTVKIDFNDLDYFGCPKVYEESGLIAKFSTDKDIALRDLHINEHDANSCCLGVYPEYVWSGLSNFIRDKIIPFLYWQSFYRRMYRPPWPGLSHGKEGVVEEMCLPPAQCAKGCSRNILCPCGSGRKYKKCCSTRDAQLLRLLFKNGLA